MSVVLLRNTELAYRQLVLKKDKPFPSKLSKVVSRFLTAFISLFCLTDDLRM